jgi:radical SAM protein with 4Fe4S-binding SPASM domain
VIDALGQVQRLAAERDLRIHCTMPIPPCVVDPADYPHVQFGQCAVGTDQAEYAVDPRGRLKLCTLQKDTIGSLLESSLGDLLARGEAQRFRDAIPAFCRPCPHRQTCMGGCRAAAQWVCGRVDELDPFIAQHVRPRHSTAGRSPAAARADEQGGIRVDPWFDLVYHVLAHLSVEPSDASSLYEPRYIQAMGAQLSASGAGRTLVEDATLMASLYVQCGQGHRLHAWPLLHASVEEFLAGATAGFGQLAWDDIRRQDLAATMQSSLGMPLIELFRLALAEEWEGGYGQAWRQTILPKASAYRPVFASHLSEIGDSLAQIGSARWVLSYPMGRHGRLLSFANDAPTVVVGVADPDSGVDEWFPLMQGCHELFVHRAQAAVPCEGAFSTVRGRPGYEAFGRCEDAALRMGEEFFGGTRWQGAYRAWRSSVAPLAGT